MPSASKLSGLSAGGIAHEFNNILGALLGYSEMALQRAGEGQCRALPPRNDDNRETSGVHCEPDLDLKPQSRAGRRPINLVEAVRDALPLISASLPNLEVNAPLVSDEDCKMLGHPVELQQIVMNLCKNACEGVKRPDPGRISLSMSSSSTM